jgi:pimeloyl-[acyl-carrier protein] methyl ester esterase
MDAIKLVLLPGLDGTGILFRPLIAALPKNIEPIVVSYPANIELGYDKLFSVVQEFLPQDSPFVLLGESFGGPLALRIAATHPLGLKALILSASFVSCPHSVIPTWAAALIPTFPFRAFPQLSRLKALLGGYSNDELLSLSKQALSQVHANVLAYRVREIIKVDVAAELKACELPILYIQGTEDLVVPGANLKRILRVNSAVQSVQFPAPHMVLQTQPHKAADAIENFIVRDVFSDL